MSHADILDTEEILENRQYDEQREESLLINFKQIINKIVVIFAAYLPTEGATNEQFVHYLFIFAVIATIAYIAKLWLEIKATVFYQKVGHYVHQLLLDTARFIFDFFVVGIFGIIRARGEFTIKDIPYVVFLLVMTNLSISVWIRHTKYRRFVYSRTQTPPVQQPIIMSAI